MLRDVVLFLASVAATCAEPVLGNVLVGTAPIKSAATIRFHQGDKKESFAWSNDGATLKSLAAVSVFDSHCAPLLKTDRCRVPTIRAGPIP